MRVMLVTFVVVDFISTVKPSPRSATKGHLSPRCGFWLVGNAGGFGAGWSRPFAVRKGCGHGLPDEI